MIDAFPASCGFGDLCDRLYTEEEYQVEVDWEDGMTPESLMEDIQDGLRASIGALLDIEIFEAHAAEPGGGGAPQGPAVLWLRPHS